MDMRRKTPILGILLVVLAVMNIGTFRVEASSKETMEENTVSCKHDGGTVIDEKEATCTEDGYWKVKCALCDVMINYRTYEKFGHKIVSTELIRAGFEKDGSETFGCKRCDYEFTKVIPGVQKPVLLKTVYEYSSSTKSLSLRVWDRTEELVTSYDLLHSGDRKTPGEHSVTVVLNGKYEGEETLTYKILPRTPGMLKANLYGHDDVKLSWVGVSGSTGYDIFYKKGNAATKKLYCNTDETSVDIPNLTDNTEYEFFVQAYYEGEAGRYTSEKCATVKIKTMKQLEPPEESGAVLIGYDDVELTWSKVKNAEKYKIYYKKPGTRVYGLFGETTGTKYVKRNLEDGVKYEFKIIASYEDPEYGTRSAFDYAVTYVYTLKELEAPEIEKISNKEIKLKWENITGKSGYQISRSTSKTGTNIISRTTKNSKVYEPAKNVVYYYKVRAYKDVQGVRIFAPWSQVSSYGVIHVDNAANVKAVLNKDYDDIKVSWSKSSGANKYQIYSKSELSPKYKLLKETTKTYITMKNFKDGMKYTFKVVPVYETDGEILASGTSKTASVYTLKKLEQPTIKKATGGKVKVLWENINGESGYQISQSTSKTRINIVSAITTTSGKEKIITATRGKVYYYKVRAYKTVNGTKVYGPWSEVEKYVR